ncbi:MULTISPECIES: SHOCT domain-containing protein [Pseudoalteromonas]|jgi:putative membrane protein|uniref:SHOCT domain-containing protein n=1 Tax=Pseudoalteromonas arctica A 37-1-2 TaxID=1117313 RepID=A0A290S2N7_9GAMM|nr:MULTISPECIES: SHOCT domain-containing protein [Pseudoalteromonas]ATC86322.1 hypothetical protein PARC_a1744 [Pseudoalteromonas arctica A 37-1-2]MBG9990330.1 SHOCT domain-containing protein [Pseudoalteromonas sp. NZS37]MBG9998336.1 SHOCT domain-containing protein [Pseudoalteromonas sp. NSLLW24]MBH0001828.1 SHOCT domain-containing protein [Pseudoalteromonas sp. SWYJZ12]MBH0015761.1 SHOCT domain-containing protein [Pseudoalteromonas sp. NGC95]
MGHEFWSEWYSGWGWFLWFGMWLLLISSLSHWGYSYRTHRRYGLESNKTAIDILNERYASGDIDKKEFEQKKQDITTTA